MKDWKPGRLERCKGILTWWTLKHECACINWIHRDMVGFEWRFNSSNSGLRIFFNLNLVWDLSFSRLFVHRVYRRPFFVVTLTRVCVCVCVSHRRGLSAKFPQNLSLALWFKAGQLIQGRTEGEKECEEEEEWPTEGEKVGRMPDSIESLCSVWSQRMRI